MKQVVTMFAPVRCAIMNFSHMEWVLGWIYVHAHAHAHTHTHTYTL